MAGGKMLDGRRMCGRHELNSYEMTEYDLLVEVRDGNTVPEVEVCPAAHDVWAYEKDTVPSEACVTAWHKCNKIYLFTFSYEILLQNMVYNAAWYHFVENILKI